MPQVSKTPAYKFVKAVVKDKKILKGIRENMQTVLNAHGENTNVDFTYDKGLGGCFIFSQSPQGFEYWYRITRENNIF